MKKLINSILDIMIGVIFLIGIYVGYTYVENTILKDNEYLAPLTDIIEDNPYIVDGDGDLIDKDELDKIKDSGIKYEEQNFDSVYYPYYNMLNINEKKLYNQLYANINAYSTYFKPTVEVTTSEVKNTVEAIYEDHPELFWLDSSFSYKYTNDNKVVQITLKYNDTINNIDKAKEQFDTAVNTIINNARKLNNEYEIEKYVHNTLIDNIEYDLNSTNNQSAYSALINGRTVCAGYSRAFQIIMIKLNIPTYYVAGISEGDSHAWNLVKLSDGYYNVDLTWDDNNKENYFLNMKEESFKQSHTRSGLSVNLPAANGTKYLNSYSIKPQPSKSSQNIEEEGSSEEPPVEQPLETPTPTIEEPTEQPEEQSDKQQPEGQSEEQPLNNEPIIKPKKVHQR